METVANPSHYAASQSRDLEQQALDEQRTTTVTCRRPELDHAGDGDSPHKINRSSPPLQLVPWTATTETPCSSLTSWASSTRSSAPSSIHHDFPQIKVILGS
ncbi:uncharacterized protein [Triticum aestivum]|uniref:uncharacterized protein n=1 Tax=Triticum aestivum TaxID=4565 RepID=UPI001D0191B2|nr:uncharacterized protein LOC123147932 [Triticum aestivum]